MVATFGPRTKKVSRTAGLEVVGSAVEVNVPGLAAAVAVLQVDEDVCVGAGLGNAAGEDLDAIVCDAAVGRRSEGGGASALIVNSRAIVTP